jgi:hypothetical protein
LADIHDIKSLGALENLKLNSVKDVEVDRSQSLYALLNYALLRQAKNWHFFYHSNSGEIQDSRDAETTSHFFGWYQRDFFSHPKNPVLTFTVGMNVSNEKDEKSLGERFFYGVDYFNGQLKESYKPSAKIIIEPSSSGSKIEFDHNLLKISLGEDLVVSGYTSFGETRLVFLPLTKVDSTNYLMRGEAKTEFFKNFFKDLDVTVFPKLDMNEGIIVL